MCWQEVLARVLGRKNSRSKGKETKSGIKVKQENQGQFAEVELASGV